MLKSSTAKQVLSSELPILFQSTQTLSFTKLWIRSKPMFEIGVLIYIHLITVSSLPVKTLLNTFFLRTLIPFTHIRNMFSSLFISNSGEVEYPRSSNWEFHEVSINYV